MGFTFANQSFGKFRDGFIFANVDFERFLRICSSFSHESFFVLINYKESKNVKCIFQIVVYSYIKLINKKLILH